MKNLVIIGNGFDIAHQMPTSYFDFRKYLCSEYGVDPDIEDHVTPIPEPTQLPDGGEEYNRAEVGLYFIEEIDITDYDGTWGNLETCLGREIFYYIRDELRKSDVNDKDNEIGNDADVNTQLVSNLNYAFGEFKQMFYKWVHEKLGILPRGYQPDTRIANALSSLGDSLFLSFNYTYTLEKLYGVKNVLHIHGTVDAEDDDILFGHNIEESVMDLFPDYFGVEDIDNIQRFLHKDTQAAILRNSKFFNNLDSVTDIYSYGFSFSEPDQEYLDEIGRHIDPKKTAWHLNKYDSTNDKYISLLKERGYIVDTKNPIW